MICMQLVVVEWAKQPPYTIPHRVRTCNTTFLATIFDIFEWYLANTSRLCPTTNSNNGCSDCPDGQIVALRTHFVRIELGVSPSQIYPGSAPKRPEGRGIGGNLEEISVHCVHNVGKVHVLRLVEPTIGRYTELACQTGMLHRQNY